MRAGFVYAAICVTLAAFTQVDAKTVTETRTVTTTEYRDRVATNTPALDEKPAKDLPPKFENGGVTMETHVPDPTTTVGSETGNPVDPTPSTDTTTTTTDEAQLPAPAPPSSGSSTDSTTGAPPAPTGTDVPPAPPAPTGTDAASMPPAGTGKPNNQAHKPSSAAGYGNAKSSASSGAPGFTFSPMTLAPESSLVHKPTSLREMTASKHAATATDAHHASAGTSAFYGASYAAVAGMTVLGMVASALVL